MWKLQASFEGNDISGLEFLGITENEGERFQLKFCTRTQYQEGWGIVIMKVIVSWRRGRNCWRSTFDVATDQLRSLKSWRSLNRHRCLVNLQPHVSVANYPISAQDPPHRLHLIPSTPRIFRDSLHRAWKSFPLRLWINFH